MKITLINPYPEHKEGITKANIYPPLGIAYIAAVLEKNGYDCRIIDANVLQLENKEVIELVLKYNPDVVCISINISTATSGIFLSKELKKLNKKVIMGGVHASTTVEKTLKDSGADAVIIGESEITALELINNNCNPKDILGVAYLENNKVIKTGKRPLIENLDTLPYPAYRLLPLKEYKTRSRKSPAIPILTSRGCPYKCVFCCSSSKESVFENRFRARSPENVVDEIYYLVNGGLRVKQIDVMDDNFAFDMERAEKICDLIIERKIKVLINMQSGLRADRLTRKLVFKFKQAGVFKVGIGIESGNKEIIKNIKKALDLDKVKQSIRWFREAGIIVQGFFIFGLVGDNETTMQDTINFAIEANPHIATFTGVLPFPKTELYEVIENKGKFTSKIEDGIKGGYLSGIYPYELGEVNQELINKYIKKAFFQYYFRLPKIIEIMRISFSLGEIKWTLKSGIALIKGIFMKKTNEK